ncbi:hypothetical protein [Flavobacterium sp.]|uniref:hypothetical protein n=1 Tax=Flavobacterium sp. TaxID=239 RepID=UPI0025F6A79A|nr:hypothetical protein [Flavobacterium sp.]
MTPKQKAKELIKKHTLYQGDNGALREYYTDKLEAKRHCIKTIDEIYNLSCLKIGQYLKSYYDKENYYSFWEEVKSEIENL